MNKIDYTIQTLQRMNKEQIGPNQFLCLVILAKEDRALTVAEVIEMTKFQSASQALNSLPEYIECKGRVKVGFRSKNAYMINDEGKKLVRRILE